MFANRGYLGAFAALLNVWACWLLRRFEKQTCNKTFPCNRPSDYSIFSAGRRLEMVLCRQYVYRVIGFCYDAYMPTRKASTSDNIKRSFVKSITFRILVVVSDGVITFALTHRYDLTIGFVVFTNLASTALYYFHERVWAHVRWGRRR